MIMNFINKIRLNVILKELEELKNNEDAMDAIRLSAAGLPVSALDIKYVEKANKLLFELSKITGKSIEEIFDEIDTDDIDDDNDIIFPEDILQNEKNDDNDVIFPEDISLDEEDNSEFDKAMSLIADRHYDEAYEKLTILDIQGHSQARLVLLIMESLGHGTQKKTHKVYEVDEAIERVRNTNFLYELSKKIFNKELFKDDLERACKLDENSPKIRGIYFDNKMDLACTLGPYVEKMSTVAASRGHTEAQKFVNNRTTWYVPILIN